MLWKDFGEQFSIIEIRKGRSTSTFASRCEHDVENGEYIMQCQWGRMVAAFVKLYSDVEGIS